MTGTTQRRIAVIGAGPIGLAAAAHLVAKGEAPVVLEAGARGLDPVELAAPVAVGAVRELADRFDEIRFVFLDEASRRPFATALDAVG